jgi:molybdopterin/thiamine biosynthesis adenylyltransferase
MQRLQRERTPLFASLAFRRDGAEREALVREEASPTPRAAPRVELQRFAAHQRGSCYLHWLGCERASGAEPAIQLGVLDDGSICGAVAERGALLPLEELCLTGERAERRRNGNAPNASTLSAEEQLRREEQSRTIGALGSLDAWQRLVDEPIALIGCSRSGDLLIEGLARLGLRRAVTIDPKRLAPHHLPASNHLRDFLGEPKVLAEAARLRRSAPELELRWFYAALEDPDALRAAASCTALFTCTDRGEPRLLANLLARAYHRTQLDIGTGIELVDGTWSAGADLRLLLPGFDEPCILCSGGVELFRPARGADFRSERLGSLRSLNELAVSYALFLYEQLATGAIERSLWVRLRLDRAGNLRVERLPLSARAGCALCARAGGGDAVWS